MVGIVGRAAAKSAPPATIVRLGPADIARVRKLNSLFGAAFGEPKTYEAEPPDDAYLADLLARQHIVVLAAVAGEAVLGGLVAYELDKLERARREFYLYDLAVDAEHRRQGIATALIAYLCEVAAVRGTWVIYVQADHGDAAAIALYKGLGVGKAVRHFDIPISRPP